MLKSLAHPEWPYTGTPHEWRGFAEKVENPKVDLNKVDLNLMKELGYFPHGMKDTDYLPELI